jgi:tetratricopeptide (TPR) repeat protein
MKTNAFPSLAAAFALAAAGLALGLAAAPPAAAQGRAAQPAAPDRAAALATAQELVDAERPEEALALLEPLLKKDPADAQALLLRSTARFMLGEIDAGRADLERALQLDPNQRRAWLNRAALDLAGKDYGAALEAFRRAEALDPRAPDNDLNIGAVLLLQGELRPASERFARYLEANPRSADAFYLVATNYAVAGYEALAIEHLRRAVDLDELARLRARTDPNFADLEDNPRFAGLLNVDTYRPPEGAYTAAQTFDVPYDPEAGALLDAVVYTLQLAGRPFDPRVEVTDAWAVVRGDLRVKISNTLGNRGLVQVSAPAEAFTPAEWRARTEELFRGIQVRLATRQRPAATDHGANHLQSPAEPPA